MEQATGALAPQSAESLRTMEEFARMLAKNEMLPKDYQGRPGNVFAALQLSREMGVGPITLMRGTFFPGGRPAFDAQFAVGRLRSSGAIAGTVKYEEGDEEGGRARAFVTTREGELIHGPWVSMQMAQADGWTRNPKYKSIPRVMLRKRAATFLVREAFPEVLGGFHTTDELEDAYASGSLEPREVTPEPVSLDDLNREAAGEAAKDSGVGAEAFDGMGELFAKEER